MSQCHETDGPPKPLDLLAASPRLSLRARELLDLDLASRVLCCPADLHTGAFRWIGSDRPRADEADLYIARVADGAVGCGPTRLSGEIRQWAAGRPLGQLLLPSHVRRLREVCARKNTELQDEWGPIFVSEPGLRRGHAKAENATSTVRITGDEPLTLSDEMGEQVERALRWGEGGRPRGIVLKGELVAIARGMPRRSGVLEAAVFVEPSYRGQGLGRAVARDWLGSALADGCVVMWCTTWDHVPSQRIARAIGCVPYAEVLC